MEPMRVAERTEISTLFQSYSGRSKPMGPESLPRHLAQDGKASLARVIVLMTSGALPVSAIPLYILGVLPMNYAAPMVVSLMTATAMLIKQGSPEGWWAGQGVIAGLVAVTVYDGLRLSVTYIVSIWPDFIPRLGGWIMGTNSQNVIVGYIWRYLGDGAGIAVAFFVFCGALMNTWPSLVSRWPVALAIGYGVFIWLGLIATVILLPRGEELLFVPTVPILVLSFLGHLIYGAVLGVFLSRSVRQYCRGTSRAWRRRFS
jgi:hypothetical protein